MEKESIDLDFIPDECYEEVRSIIDEFEFEEQYRRKEKDIIEIYRTIQSQNTSSRDVTEQAGAELCQAQNC